MDPGLAALIGAGIGAVAALLGSFIGPIVRDMLARRAVRSDNGRDKRERLALDVLDTLDEIARTRDDTKELRTEISQLVSRIELVDGEKGEMGRIVGMASLHAHDPDELLRNLISGYSQKQILKWGRSEPVDSFQEYMNRVGEIIDAAEVIKQHRIDDHAE